MPTINTISGFKDYVNIAKQATTGSPDDWGVAAPNTPGAWYRLRSGPVTINPTLTKARPTQESTGNRDVNSQIAVPGRRFSEGSLPTVWRADTGALLALAALGSETVAEDPATTGRWKHTFRCADSPPWLTIDSFMGAEVSNLKQLYRHIGCGINEVTWNFDANDDAGLLMADYSFMAKFYELLGEAALPYTNPDPSDFVQIAAWRPVISIDSVQDNYFVSMQLTINNGYERVKSATGEQDDQGQVAGPRTVTATVTRVLKKGDTETFANLANTTDTLDLLIDMRGFTAVGTGVAPNDTDKIQFHIPKAEVNAFPARTINANWKIETIEITGVRDEAISGPLEIIIWNDKATAY